MGLKNHLDSARGDDVVHRLSGGPNLAALAQAMNNVGKAIRIGTSPCLRAYLLILGIESARRLIGTVRREYLDQVFFWNTVDLVRKLQQFKRYYNQRRVHQSLNGATPQEKGGRPIPLPINLKHYSWQSHCNGLFELPIAA